MVPASDPPAAERQFFDALVAGDVKALEEVLSDDFILIDVMRGSEIQKAGLVAAIASGQVKFASIEPIDTRVRRFQSAAVITGRTQMKGVAGETPFALSSRYTHVLVEQQGRWRMVSAQGTKIAE